MEPLALLGVLWVLFILIAPVWLVIQVLRLRSDRFNAEQRLLEMNNRVQRVETDLRNARAEIASLKASGVAPATPSAPEATQITARPVVLREPQPVAPLVRPPAPPVHTAPPKPVPPAPVVPPPAPVLPPVTTVPPVSPIPPATPPKPIAGAIAPPKPPAPPRPYVPPPPPAPSRDWRGWLDLFEQKFGTDWLNKLGVIGLVVGITLWAGYKLADAGPLAKVLASFAAAGAMLGAGIFFESRDRYRILARAGIGGGWALLFFTVYAMHHVDAARIIDSQPLDLVLLLGVAIGMVLHTLRYDSQVVTGLAFLLAFATVTISRNTVYSLSAGAVLALGIAIIALRKQWYQLEIFGLLASYLNHFFWLRLIIEPMGAAKHTFPEFVPSAALLILYWGIFRWSYIRRTIDDDEQENISTLAAILNTLFLLGLMKYQSVQTGLAFYVLLVLGLVEMLLAQLPITRKRRTAFVVLTTVGATLALAAVPFRYSGGNGSILWLAQAEAFLLAGLFTREKLFRQFGLIAGLLTAGNLLRITLLIPASSTLPLSLTLAFCALVLYADAQFIPRRWKSEIKQAFEQMCFQALSYLAAGLLFTAIWVGCDAAQTHEWVAIGWAAAGLLLAYTGWAARMDDLSIQAHLFALAAFIFALAANQDATELYLGVTLRALTFSLLAVILYVSARWSGPVDHEQSAGISALYTSAATACLALVAYYEVPGPWIAVAWVVMAFVLNYLGRTIGRSELNWQAHVLSAMVVVRAIAYNFPLDTAYGRISLRLATIAAIIVVFYALARLADREDAAHKETSRALYSWAGSLLVGTLLWYELRPLNVALGWAIFGLALFEIGAARKSLSLRAQGYLAYLLAFGRIFFVNMNADGVPGALSPRLYTTLPLALIFFYCYWRTQSDEAEFPEVDGRMPVRELLCYFGTIVMAALVRFEFNLNWVVAGWATLILLLLALAWRSKLPVFLHQAYLLSGAAAFRTVFHHFFERAHTNPSWMESRMAAVGAGIALLFLGLAFAFPLRKRMANEIAGSRLAALVARPEQWFFFLPLGLLVGLLYVEVRAGLLTVAWGVLAVAVFLFAIWAGQRSYRMAGLVLLLTCILKIVFVDVWKLEPGDRYLAFIGLSAAMLFISFLYTRYKDTIKRFL